MTRYQVQIHFDNRGQFNFEYTPEANETIDDFLSQYDGGEEWQLTGDEDSWALVQMSKVTSICAVPVPEFQPMPGNLASSFEIPGSKITKIPEGDYAVDQKPE